jgi:two-component system, chemotaxis family, CheB/CheR fusion protein
MLYFAPMGDGTPAVNEPVTNEQHSAPGDSGGAENTSQTPDGTEPANAFAIVGIGASAGGLEAVSQLLEALPDDTGMAFVLVQHLDPKHESKLDSILAKATSMSVREAAHGTRVEPNNIYIIPPNATMTIAGGVLQLTPRGEGAVHHLPIDSFFKSLAQDRQSGAIGIVLSGTGSDGTLGLEDLKAAGGITFAQDEESARFPGMPMAAAVSGCVDLVLAPAEIARELVRISRHPYVVAQREVAAPSAGEEHFRKILELLHATFGVDFSAYRDNTVRRRITRRMVLNVMDDLGQYAQHLASSRDELDALYRDILIGVTNFFREPESFEALKRSVFPEITKGKSQGVPLRIWVPGCSTGQEAYSLAIAVTEYLDDKPTPPAVQIFATDLADTHALQKAREGVYPETIAGEVSPERLRRFFTKEDGNYRVNKTIREMCLFAKQNVATDPPFSRVDLISCRNLLIYLAPPLQKRVIPTFHYALNPEGFLLLGASETVGNASDLFALVDRPHRIYRKRQVAVRTYPHFAVKGRSLDAPHRVPDREPVSSTADWLREADRLVLSRYSPPGALLNSEFHVLQFRGETGAYLKPSPGEASLNILKMAREGLFLELRSALAEARSRKVEVRRQGVRIHGESETREIDLRVLPVRLPARSEECFLVLFQDEKAQAEAPAEGPRTGDAAGPGTRLARWLRRLASEGDSAAESESDDARTLRRELGSTRDYLQSLIEDQDAANEELKSANEEILSTNEELQSTNEELETAKEELQSVNEELTTVNDQLQTRNAELSRLNDDVTNLITSTDLPMVAVGVDLRIRRVTPAATKLFNILSTDIGRPIDNLKPAVDIPDLDAIIAEVIENVKVHEREVRDRDGRHHMLRVLPYRTADNRIDGAVVVLVDIEEITSQAARLREKGGLLELSSDAIIVRNRDSTITFWNHGAEATYGWKASEAIGKSSQALLQRRGSSTGEDIDAMLRTNDRWQGEITHARRDGSRIVVDSRQVVQRDPRGDVLAILEINRDITERRRMIDELAAADRAKDNFLATLAHELRNPLTPLRNGVEVLRMVGPNAPDAVKVRETFERNIRRMTRLVDDLLDVSRITHGHIELRKENLDMVEVVRDVISELRSMAESAGDKVTVELPAKPLLVDADPVRLTQIIENVLHNAVKYTEHGTIGVSLSAADGNAVLRVRDSGIGIAKENLGRIWEPFVQADSSLERRRSGLGLGLTLVRTLVDLHGGSVSGMSEGPDKGSEFVLRMPLAKRHSEAPAESKPKTELKGRRILIVDDNADAAASFASLLKLMENDVCTAATGEEALRVAKEYRPDIVLLDIGLPGMNGYKVARALRAEVDGRMFIIAVSGYGAEQDRRRSAEAGFDAHFVKPMEMQALEEFLGSREQGGRESAARSQPSNLSQ